MIASTIQPISSTVRDDILQFLSTGDKQGFKDYIKQNHITSLDFSGCSEFKNPKLMTNLVNALKDTDIQSLTIRSAGLSDREVFPLWLWLHTSNVKSLDLADNDIRFNNPSYNDIFVRYIGLSKLESLNMRHNCQDQGLPQKIIEGVQSKNNLKFDFEWESAEAKLVNDHLPALVYALALSTLPKEEKLNHLHSDKKASQLKTPTDEMQYAGGIMMNLFPELQQYIVSHFPGIGRKHGEHSQDVAWERAVILSQVAAQRFPLGMQVEEFDGEKEAERINPFDEILDMLESLAKPQQSPKIIRKL